MNDYEKSWQDPTTKVWVRHVLDEMVPKMANSTLVTSIMPTGEHSEGDVKYWVELGASIMMDKPIVIVVFGDAPVPDKLQLLADEVVRLPEGVNPAAAEELIAAFDRVMKRKEGQ